MNLLESKLHYPFGDTLPEPATSLEVAPGVRWIRMPLPFVLDHINLWLLRDRIDGVEGWTVVDCGIGRDEVKALWQTIFETQLEGLPVLRVICTHMHPDHVGLADWICQQWGVPLWMSMTDYMTAKLWSSVTNGAGTGGVTAAAHFASHGLQDPEALAQLAKRASYYSGLVPRVPDAYIRMLDGDVIKIGDHHWQAIVGYGHAPEHIALFCPELKVLISGDMLLPRISTNISVFDIEPMANPLPLYLRSIESFRPLPEDTLILPSHGKPFTGLHERVNQQQDHHRDRLAEVLEACNEPRSTHDILPVLFKRKLDLHQTTFAMGEATAHLHALYFEGKLTRHVDADGVIRFTRV